MQQAITRRDVYEPSLNATINGRPVEVSSVSVDRGLPDPLARGQLRAASVDLVAVEGQNVTETVATPWDPGTAWPPVPQSPASVSMDTGAGPLSLLGGGLVMSAEGGTAGREVQAELADRYESLNKTISWDAVADIMPHTQEATLPRYVGMGTTAITDTILRHCGWYTTPPQPSGWVTLDVPAQGSLWPEKGTVYEANRTGGGYPYWLGTSWGVGVADVDALYRTVGAYTIAGRKHLELSAMTETRGDSAAQMRVDAYLGGDARSGVVRLTWNDQSAQLRIQAPGGSISTAASVTRANGLLYATVKYLSATSVEVTLRSGTNTTVQTVTVPSSVTSTELRWARIWGTGRAGGFQVAVPTSAGALAGWTANAVLYPRTSNRNALMVRPSVESETCADLLAAQCEAEGATYWIDETGVLRWWDLARLEAQSSVATLTSDDDIAGGGFTWRHDLSQVKSRAVVNWREPLREMSWRTTIDLWQGNGGTLQPSDDLETWVKPEDDEVWIMPSLSLGEVGVAYPDFNYGIGSWFGAIVDGDNTDEAWAQLYGTLAVTIERVTDRAFKLRTRWTGSTRVATQRTHSEYVSGIALWKRRYNFDLPIIRGKARITFADQIAVSTQSGPATAPEHEIDAGWWIQSEAQAKYTADYAGARLTVPQPVLSSIALIPIPGLQLGDVVEVRDEHVTRLTIRGIVIEDSRSINADMDMSHAVSIRPTYVTRNGVTWEEWGQAASVTGAGTYQSWGSRQSGNTYQQWGANPLLGEDVL